MSMTLTEKLLSRSAGKDKVVPGDVLFAKLDGLMGHDLKASAFQSLEKKLNKDKVFDPEKIWMIFDHHVPANTTNAALQQKILRNYIKKYGIKNFFDIGRGGICHVVVPEKGFVKPGDVVVGGDSHTCTYGAMGAFSTGMGNTDFAYALAFGEVWLQVPPSIRVNIYGDLPEYFSGKDVMLNLLKTIGTDGATYKALEFCGESVKSLSMSDRFTICNMVVEAGAKNGIFPADERTLEYLDSIESLSQQQKEEYLQFKGDDNAVFEKTIDIDCSQLSLQVACPHLPDNVVDVEMLKDTKVDQVFIGSCTNGRLEDLKIAAEILKGKEVDPSVRLIVIPGSQNVLEQALEDGTWKVFLEAGAILGPPACGPCFGTDLGVLGEGEVALSTANRNFKGRMGNPKSDVYLSSPAVAAASAITGFITHPGEVKK